MPAGNMTTTRAASKATLKSKLESATSVPIRKFICADLNKDGKKEAIAMTLKSVDELGYVDASFWYIASQACEKVGSSDGMCVYPASIKNTMLRILGLLHLRQAQVVMVGIHMRMHLILIVHMKLIISA